MSWRTVKFVSQGGMDILVGTSGWSYTPWRGVFYPEKLAPARMLAFYAERLPTVEVNNTFYRMPKPEQLEKWAAETPPHFRFAPKAPQLITHRQRLVDSADSTAYFLKTIQAFGERLGPILFQLPPFLRADVARLRAFLTDLRTNAPDVRVAFEFRHQSWFTDETEACLREANAALCIADTDDETDPFWSTARYGYLRLRKTDYDEAALASWAARLRAPERAWDAAFVYFKHEDAGRGPQLAARLRTLLGEDTAAPTGA